MIFPSTPFESRTQQIRNLCNRPIPLSSSDAAGLGWGSYSGLVTAKAVGTGYTSGVFGSVNSFWRFTVNGTPTTDGTIYLIKGSASGSSSNPVVPGRKYTLSTDGRTSFLTQVWAQFEWYTSAGVFITSSSGTKVTANPNVITRVSVTAIAPANAAFAKLEFMRGTGVGGKPVDGDYVDASKYMFTEGSTTFEYSDGNTPGWKWDGVANGSTSVGYPYTLSRVAGGLFPIFDCEGPAGKVSTSFPSPVNQITVFSVVDYLILLDAQAVTDQLIQMAIGNYGDTPPNTWLGLRINGPSTGTTPSVFVVRRTGGGGPIGAINLPVGRHLATWGINNDSYSQIQTNNDAVLPRRIDSVQLGSGFSKMQVISARANIANVRTVAFDGWLSDPTRLAVNRWFANKYGFAIAA